MQKDLREAQARITGVEITADQDSKDPAPDIGNLKQHQEKIVALQAEVTNIRDEASKMSEELKKSMYLKPEDTAALRSKVAHQLKGAQERLSDKARAIDPGVMDNITGGTQRAAKESLSKSTQEQKEAWDKAGNVEKVVEAALQEIDKFQLLQDITDLKVDAGDAVNKLGILEMRYDQTILGAYVRQKMRSTLSSGEFCEAVNAAASVGAKGCSNGLFEAQASKRASGVEPGSWDDKLRSKIVDDTKAHRERPASTPPTSQSAPSN